MVHFFRLELFITYFDNLYTPIVTGNTTIDKYSAQLIKPVDEILNKDINILPVDISITAIEKKETQKLKIARKNLNIK